MKHLQAVLVLALLIASKRYRQRWQHTIEQVDASLDAIAASRRRIDAMENGGPPKVRVSLTLRVPRSARPVYSAQTRHR